MDTTLANNYEAQPGRQEWVTVIECVSATGEKIPPFVIFKGLNVMTSWLPTNLPLGWQFRCNATGWTNNYYGLKWIEHFESATRNGLRSPDDFRLLLCDGHDSHISADFVLFCIEKQIDLVLLPPHSSHLLQPLDVGIFGPLKTAILHQLSCILRMGISRLQKVEWLERFVLARERAITKDNILGGWRGTGLFPENMHRILIQIPDIQIVPTTPTPSSTSNTMTPFLPNSSPPDPSVLRSTNQAFLTEISTADISTPVKTHMRRLSGISERLQARVDILEVEVNEIKMVNAQRKERQCGKRLILKDTPVVSTEVVQKALAEAEKATKAKQKKKGRKCKQQTISSDEEEESSSDNSPDDLELLGPEVLDCIEVVS